MSRRSDDPAELVEALYVFADALKAAEKALAAIPYAKRPEFDVLADKPACLGELGDVAKAVNAIADDWQSELDTAVEAAAEADDRRRDNPPEPDFRRRGQ